jgi:primosomal replication protein N
LRRLALVGEGGVAGDHEEAGQARQVGCQILSDVVGEVISKFSTDLRMGDNYSWCRGVRSLMKNAMLATE